MRVVKLAIISVFFLSLIVLLFSFLLPSEVRVSRSITIHESVTRITTQLTDLENWERWNVMLKNPDNRNIRVSEKSFLSDELTVKLDDNDPIRTTWTRSNGRRINSGFNIVYASSDSTLLQWYFDFQLKWYPWEKFGSIVFDKQLGPVMEKSLDNLKSIVEDSL